MNTYLHGLKKPTKKAEYKHTHAQTKELRLEILCITVIGCSY